MKNEKEYTALVIGAGPGGLTAGYELLSRTNIKVVVFEGSNHIGGISKTINYKGNRIDIGGHRFFSKSERVMEWWKMFFPIQDPAQAEPETGTAEDQYPDPATLKKVNNVMLIRNRLSRIFYLRRFFDYPLSLSPKTLKNLGITRIVKIGWGYTLIRFFPIKNEKNLEDFFINRFGKELYTTFFKDYTEKVWGIPCDQIQSDWGAQRIKGLSVSKAIFHAITMAFKKNSSIEQKKTETSLIDKFMYPKYGPGQLWEEVAEIIKEKGGQVICNHTVHKIEWIDKDHVQLTVLDVLKNERKVYSGNYLFSTMPVKDLINSMGNNVTDHIKRIANGLPYRDFMTVGLLLKKLRVKNTGEADQKLISDNWIYIQEKDVAIGRLQIFNNWSPYMVADPEHAWVGLEYFCNEGDDLWSMKDEQFIKFAIDELVKIEIVYHEDVLDSTLIRVPKAYPAYFGTYNEIDDVIEFTNSYENMFLIGRNGMHKYNNQDHSMLTAMVAVDNIIGNQTDKRNIWEINTEMEYHEKDKKAKSSI